MKPLPAMRKHLFFLLLYSYGRIKFLLFRLRCDIGMARKINYIPLYLYNFVLIFCISSYSLLIPVHTIEIFPLFYRLKYYCRISQTEIPTPDG